MEVNTKLELFVAIVVWVSFIGVGVFCLFRYTNYLIKSIFSKNWHKTQGIILESYLESFMDADAIDFNYIIKYEYTVEGIKYISDRVFFKSYDLSDQRYDKKYFSGQEVIVFYNPKNPKEAVLENGLKMGVHFFLLMSTILFLISVFIYIVFIESHLSQMFH